ncbi:hypothetical protein EV201_2100 [Ancylomarina subtilis]|uniref:Uncharacterized protein n=1 Tax=Ancylomarina subtilis TaxID=1639035 RepID=A0A4Q7VM96_9BACT|nr:hypothetical protein [Ancylomarina subtilis]RZT97430.1 hypothetical protein EV201_2100 [Ancylomarina subtilis]
MKKLIYMASILALTFTSCDPMEDVYDEVDKANAEELADKKFYSDKTLIEDGYRLVDADFELSTNEDVKNYKNFSISLTAAEFLPEILTNKMLYGETGVEYKVWFDYYRGKSEELSNYRNEHEVSTGEYTAIGGVIADLGYFTSDIKSGDKADEILKAAYSDAVKGDVQKLISKGAASKSYKFEDVSIEASEKFEMSKDDFGVILASVEADDTKKHLVDGTLEYYYGANSKYGNFEARTSKWMAKDEYKDMDEADLEDLIYNRQIEAVIIALKAKFPEAQINDASGKKIIYIVEYSVYDGSTKDNMVRFECTSAGPNPEFAKVGSMYVNTMHQFYMYNGSVWNQIDNDLEVLDDKENNLALAYTLEYNDYKLMGDGDGQPGEYGNFSSSADPNHYLPTFMNNKWAYAQDDEVKLIIYKYYNSGVTELRVDEYTFNKETKWMLTATTVDGSAMVAFKDKIWIYVPPIKLIKTEKDATETYELTAADYELVGNGRYGNFDTRSGEDEEDEAVIVEKLTKILKANYSLKVGDVFEVTYKYYDGAAKTGTMKLEAVADN